MLIRNEVHLSSSSNYTATTHPSSSKSPLLFLLLFVLHLLILQHNVNSFQISRILLSTRRQSCTSDINIQGHVHYNRCRHHNSFNNNDNLLLRILCSPTKSKASRLLNSRQICRLHHSNDENDEFLDDFYDDDDYNISESDGTTSSTTNSKLTPEEAEYLLEYSMDSFLRGDYDKPFAENAAAPLPGLSPRETVEMALSSLRQLDDPHPSHGAAVLLRFCAPLSRADRWGGAGSSSSSSSSSSPFSSLTAGADGQGRTGIKNSKNAAFSTGGGDGSDSGYSWKEVLRGALTPTMLARRIRASPEFSGLLDWTTIDVTDGAHWYNDGTEEDDDDDVTMFGVPSSIAYVNVALYFNDNSDDRNGGRRTKSRGENERSGGNNRLGSSPVTGTRMEPTILQFQLRRLNGVWLIDSAQKSDPNRLFVTSASQNETGSDDDNLQDNDR